MKVPLVKIIENLVAGNTVAAISYAELIVSAIDEKEGGAE